MNKIIVFGGTAEGRQIADYYRNKNIEIVMCVATEYGEKLLDEGDNLKVMCGRLACRDMKELFQAENARLIIDATHPYAEEVTANISKAASEVIEEGLNSQYIRVIRDKSTYADSSCKFFGSIEEAVEYLNTKNGKIFLTTGSKELASYSAITDKENRVFIRVLPAANVVEEAVSLGYTPKNIICMQGPFTEDLNYAMIKMLGINYLVTKDTGSKGGFPEKIHAAGKAGIETIVIGRPVDEEGLSLSNALKHIDEIFKLKSKKTVTICGIGMGESGTMTLQVKEAIENADICIGAKRLLNLNMLADKKTYPEINAYKIADFIEEHAEYQDTVVLMSGDTGFYSGAFRLSKVLRDRGIDVNVLCGISSAVYFCSKIGIPWQDMVMHSVHGRRCDFTNIIIREPKSFFLLGGETGVREFLYSLAENGLGGVEVFIGENLSYTDEKITSGTAEELKEKDFSPLSVIIVINKAAENYIVTGGISDDKFIRGETPMTKEEVRAITLSKLGLTKDAVIYDIGAGTGSVSIECAVQSYRGHVFAIEKNTEGCSLIEQNMKNFGISNVSIIEGVAPEVLENLPTATHAFIGGSSGNMKEIVDNLLKKNKNMRIVINTVTVESLAEAIEVAKTSAVTDLDVVQVNIAKNRKAGRYNLMTAQNPVYVISCTGNGQA